MKIIIVSIDLIDRMSDKDFYELTDEQLLDLCKRDKDCIGHDIYTPEELQDAWNSEDIFFPTSSFMRIIND